MNKPDLALNNRLWLLCPKTKPNQTNISTLAGCNTGSVFKQNLTGLNSEFSFPIAIPS